MKRVLALLLLSVATLGGASVYAQSVPSITDQIDAVHSVEIQEQQAQLRKQQEQEAKAAAKRRRVEKRKAAALAAQNKKEAAKKAEVLADKKRDQAYEDQQRQLTLKERKLSLQMKEAKVKRANDYIDQELRREAARTDVIQSQADSTRNISEGNKSLLESTGEAKVKKASGWFGGE